MAEPGRTLWLVARVHAPDEGGVQTYVAQTARAYAALGWQVTVFAKSSAGPRRIDDGAIRLIDVGPASMLRVYWRLFRAMLGAWLGGARPEAIHACTWRAALPALPFPRPLIVTVHGREVGRPRGAAFRLLKRVLGRARTIVAVSDATRALLLARLPALSGKTVTAWNGVDRQAENVARMADQLVRLLTVCRLVPRKNVPAAIQAVARLHGPFAYHIVGRGTDMIRVREAARQADPSGRIQLAGYVSDAALSDHYRRADIFLHPQIAMEDGAEVEGFGLSIAEAMAHGLPCIVGRAGGPAELVQDGVTGLVVDGDSIDAITAAVDLLAGDPALRRRLGDNARRWAADNLCWQRHCRLCLSDLPDDPAAAPAPQLERAG